MYVCVYACMYVCMHACVHAYVHVCVCVCVCVHVCMNEEYREYRESAFARRAEEKRDAEVDEWRQPPP